MSSVKQRNRILETDLTTLKGKVVKVKELVNPGGAVVFLVSCDATLSSNDGESGMHTKLTKRGNAGGWGDLSRARKRLSCPRTKRSSNSGILPRA
eukprot:1987945-Rhodomonas_salina.5